MQDFCVHVFCVCNLCACVLCVSHVSVYMFQLAHVAIKWPLLFTPLSYITTHCVARYAQQLQGVHHFLHIAKVPLIPEQLMLLLHSIYPRRRRGGGACGCRVRKRSEQKMDLF